ncbi:hypothetical protein H9L13_04925 [Sphingomonas lutea]|uniref:Uncharacterized protein n=1 Tax=Sphingomonas lutea TaxID=1045317 RepID=A0A7G9SK46_9SPHN|nr:hypothetical protein [Sphingomonas lutea]QNN68221.1 hypothetical protein H9L13_04925 [Sphingomonas lutea]
MARPRSSLGLTVPRHSAPAARARPAPRHARAFGRRQNYETVAVEAPARANAELRQMVNTFLGGLVFVGVLIA